MELLSRLQAQDGAVILLQNSLGWENDCGLFKFVHLSEGDILRTPTLHRENWGDMRELCRIKGHLGYPLWSSFPHETANIMLSLR